jgi:predicted phage-related endonuclease
VSRLDEILALPKVTHQLAQGTDAWHQFRLQHRGASEAAAALGLSKKMKRTELLHMKHTGLAREFSEWLQRNVLDKGHEVEAKARPLLEKLIGEDLYPVTMSRGHLSASCDGLTMDDRIAIEHKQWAEDLAAMVAAGLVPDEHMPQCTQVLLVTGAEELYFVVSDGTPERMVWAKVTREEALLWMERVVAGWDQFDADLAVYTPADIKERPAAEVTLALPALVIHAKGEITTSNMQEYGQALAKRLAEVRAIALVTDQDFSNAKESAKLLRDNIQQARLAKDAMLAQTVTVGEAARMIDAWCEDMRLTALKLEQDVEREDKAKKAAMISAARSAYEQHIEASKVATGGPWIVLPTPDWAGAIKSKRSFASMQDALDTVLANAKIAADESARKIRAALAALDDEAKGYEHLFADRLAFISKPADDVRELVKGRIAEHRAAEERRAAELAERERARIRAEEQAKLQREQEAREAEERRQREAAQQAQRQQAAAQVEQERQAEIQRRRAEANAAGSAAMEAISGAREADDLPPQLLDAMEQAASGIIADLAVHHAAEAAKPAAGPAVIPMPTRAPAAPAGPPTMTLGQIKAHIAPFQIDAAGLETLGFPPAGREGAAKLYHHGDLPRILHAAISHLAVVCDQLAKAA